MQKRYPALHIISLLFKVLSVVTIILGITLMVVVLTQGGSLPQVFGTSLLNLGAVPILLFSLVAALILWGTAELLICGVDIENNTRARATLESQPKETPPTPVTIAPPAETPVAQPPPETTPTAECEDSEEKKAAALAQRKQAIKDILNKRLW